MNFKPSIVKDKITNSIYITLTNKKVKQTQEVFYKYDQTIIVDFDKNNKIVGIEIL